MRQFVTAHRLDKLPVVKGQGHSLLRFSEIAVIDRHFVREGEPNDTYRTVTTKLGERFRVSFADINSAGDWERMHGRP
jgi:hypothetical protein